MKRSASITLVLLGGGIALSACGESAAQRECRLAMEQNRPDAAQLCARSRASSSSGYASTSSWYYGGYGTTNSARATASAVSRGGFGARGMSGG